jgi:hypothetical protein
MQKMATLGRQRQGCEMNDKDPGLTVVIGYLHRLHQQSQKTIFLLWVIAVLCAIGVIELLIFR